MGIVLAAVLAAGSASAAQAQTTPAAQPPAAAPQVFTADATTGDATVAAQQGLTQELVDKYDPYVTQDSHGAYILNLPQGKNFPAPEVQLVKKAIAQANATQKQAVESGTGTRAADKQVSTQGAHGGFKVHWWGYEMWLDNEGVGKLQKLLTAGTGVAGIAALITAETGVGGAVAGAVAAVLAGAGGLTDLCNWSDKGITIRQPFAGPITCVPRR